MDYQKCLSLIWLSILIDLVCSTIPIFMIIIQMITNQREKFQTSAIGAVELALCSKTKRKKCAFNGGWLGLLEHNVTLS